MRDAAIERMARIVAMAASARERAGSERKLWALNVVQHRAELEGLAAQLTQRCPDGPEVDVSSSNGHLAGQQTITLMFGDVRVIAQRDDAKAIVHHPASATLELQPEGCVRYRFYPAQKRSPDEPFSEPAELVEDVLPSAIDAAWLLRCMETFVHKAVASDWPAPALWREPEGTPKPEPSRRASSTGHVPVSVANVAASNTSAPKPKLPF